ncbi:MAG: RHS repeat-associated core domain-containing protein [Luteolibacter sp.]
MDASGAKAYTGNLEVAGLVSPSSADIANLKVYNPKEVNSASFDVVSDSGIVSQVKTAANLLSVAPVAGGGFAVKFYDPGQFNPMPDGTSHYEVNSGDVANPVKVISYTPVAAAGDHLGGVRVTSVANNGTIHVRDILSTSNLGLTWRVIEDGLETTDYASTFLEGTSGWTRTDLITVTKNGALYSKSMKTYRYLTRVEGPSNEVVESDVFLAEEVVYDTANTTLVTTYNDYQSLFPSTPPAAGQVGLVGSMTRPDGSWEVYKYYDGTESDGDSSWIGRLKETLRPIAGSSVTPLTATAANSESTITRYSYLSESDPAELTVASQITTLPSVGTVKKTTYAAASGPSWALVNLLHDAGLGDDWFSLINPSADIKGSNTSEYASETEWGTQFDASYRTYGTPGSLWDGRSFASLDEEGNGTVTGYERGSFDMPSGTFVADSSPTTSNGGFIRSITLSITGTYQIPAIHEATKTVTIEDLLGRVLRSELWILDTADTWALATVTTFEFTDWPDGSIREVVEKKDGRIVSKREMVSTTEEKTWDEQGIETHTVTDLLGQTLSVTRVGVPAQSGYDAQPDQVTSYSYSGHSTTSTVTAGSLSRTDTTVEDLAGRKISSTDSLGVVTLTSYPYSGRDTLTTLPGGLTSLVTRNIEGKTVSLTGSAVVDVNYEYGTLSGGNSVTTTRTGDVVNSPRYVTSETDWAGRMLHVTSPSPIGSGTVSGTSAYIPFTRRLASSSSPAGTILFDETYDEQGLLTKLSGYDIDNSEALEPSGSDRITETKAYYVFEGGFWWEVASRKVYDDITNTASAQTGISKTCLYGAPGGFASESISISPAGDTTTVMTSIDRANKTQIRIEHLNGASRDSVAVNVNGLEISQTEHDSTSPTRWNYDGFGQPTKETSPRGAITRKSYTTDGQLASTTDHAGKVTSYTYYTLADELPDKFYNKLYKTTNPDGKISTFTYTPLGQVKEQAGDTAYRVTYDYDVYGAKNKMTTYGGGSASQLTQWAYQDGTGLLASKIDPANQHVDYLYYDSGKLQQRTWARGVFTTYAYTGAGDLQTVTYSDGTPTVTYSGWDRLGRPTSVQQGASASNSENLTYHPGNGAQNARFCNASHPMLPGIGIRNTLPDTAGRPAGFVETAGTNATTVRTVTYAYDPVSGNLDTISDGTQSQKYAYHPNSSLVSTINTRTSGTSWFRESRYFDTPGRLIGIRSDRMSGTNIAGEITSHAYDYDNLGRRVKNTFQDGSLWEYGYNDRSEVTTAARKTPSGTVVPPMAATYSYDGIGNRLTSTSPVLGDHTYTPNSLNQYASITTGNSRTAMGRADASWSVLVSGTAATRIGDIYYRAITASNGSAPVWQDVVTMRSTGTPTTTNKFWYAKTPTVPTYDADGNLTNDGRWIYTWDAENRLTQMETTSQATTAGHPYTKLKFVYDSQSRRIARHVWQGGTQASPIFKSSRRWLNDGWNVVAEFSAPSDTSTALTRLNTFTWGLDLSGTLQGAGGVGGLLVQTTVSGGVMERASYDGNGNIVAWTKSTNTAPTSRREYDAFGNTLVSEGTTPCHFGFSTKMQDVETGLYYYGYRFYDPVNGRWPSRDPLAEKHGRQTDLPVLESHEMSGGEYELNIYSFLYNSPNNGHDVLGLFLGTSGDAATLIAGSGLPENITKWLSGLEIKGHNDMKNHNAKKCDAFNYKRADDDANLNAKVKPELHFREPSVSEQKLNADIDKSDAKQFELDMHAMQDYYVHKDYMKEKQHQTDVGVKRTDARYFNYMGYTINPDFHPKGTELITVWKQANAETVKWVKKWESKCCCVKSKWQKQ